MPEDSRTIECGNCGLLLEEATDIHPSQMLPCPRCGSQQRHIRVTISDTITFHEKIGIKARAIEGGRPEYEAVEGDDLHCKSGIWMKLRRLIDRLNDCYLEIVVDPRTGETVHKTDEPLSEHRGHGSAKLRKRTKKGDDA